MWYNNYVKFFWEREMSQVINQAKLQVGIDKFKKLILKKEELSQIQKQYYEMQK